MVVRVDTHAGKPLYIQIVDQIKHKIATGDLKPGDQLPTVRRLAHDLDINFNTVARAYTILDQAGIISTQQGRGSYVRRQPDREGMAQVRQDKLRAIIGHTVLEALSLGYSPGEIRDTFEATISQLNKSA